MSFDVCRDMFRTGIVDALRSSGDYVDSIGHTAKGGVPVNAIALDVYPWQSSTNLSFRLTSDPLEDRYAANTTAES